MQSLASIYRKKVAQPMWDAKTGRQIGGSIEGHTNYVSSVAFSRDGGTIVSGSDDRTLLVWRVQGDRQPRLGTALQGGKRHDAQGMLRKQK